MKSDVAAALRKLHGKKLMSFYGGRRAAARASKKLVKQKTSTINETLEVRDVKR